MGCGGCSKARADMAAKIQAQTKIREQRLEQLPPDKRLTVIQHVVQPSPISPKTPKQLRIEARNLRIARRIASKKASEALDPKAKQ